MMKVMGEEAVVTRADDITDIDDIEFPTIPPLPPLTEDERQRMRVLLEELRLERERILALRGGKLYPNSWEEFPDLYDEIDPGA